MFKKIQQWANDLNTHLTLWQLFTGGGILGMGYITAELSKASNWISQFGLFGWWCAGLAGAAIALSLLCGLAWLRVKWAEAQAINKWKEKVDEFNPLDTEFNKIRLRVADLAHPLNKRIKGKHLVNCELMGPANLLFIGLNNSLSHIDFYECDVIVVRNNARIYNALILEDFKMTYGAVWNCTLLIPISMVPAFRAMNANFLSLTGDPAIDNQLP